MPTIEEITSRMPNAQVFSVLDASSGYWQVSLDKESSHLCTFNTPFGRYRFKRLLFGISFAGNIFQAIMTEMFEDLQGVEVMVDDILVWGTNQKEHNERLEKVLQHAKQRNLTLDKEKSQISQNIINYLGPTLTKDEIKPDRNKIAAVIEMSQPVNKVNYTVSWVR